MAITIGDLIELRGKVAETRKQLEEEEAALKVLERMIARNTDHSSAAHGSSVADESGQIKIAELGVPDDSGKPTFTELVDSVVRRFGYQEFTVQHVEKVLVKEGHQINGKSPRARIAMALGQLEKKGVVDRTYEGTGSTPHRFRFKSEDDVS